MRQLNVNRKYTNLAKIWVSFVLVLLATIFAFTPIVSLDFSDSESKDSINAAYEEIFSEIGGSTPEIEIPEKIDVTQGKIINSISILVKTIQVMASESNDIMTDVEKENLDKTKAELQELLNSEEGKEAIIMTLSLFVSMIEVEDTQEPVIGENGEVIETESSSGGVSMIVDMLLNYFVIIYVILFVLVFPIVMAIVGFVTLIKALISIKKPESIAPKMGKTLITPLGFVVALALITSFTPTIVLGSGMILIMVLAILSVLGNIAISRLREYQSIDFNYINIIQGAGLLKLVGFFVFFFGALNTGILRTFIKSLVDYIADASEQVDAINNIIEINNRAGGAYISEFSMKPGYIIDIILVLFAAIATLSICVAVIKKICVQLGLTSKNDVKPGHLGDGIFAIIVCTFPIIAANLKNKIYYSCETSNGMLIINEENAGSILTLSDEAMGALVAMFIGAFIILSAEIATLVLKKIFCPNMDSERANLVLSGRALEVVPEVEETVSANEAPATEAAADEAPVVETNADEAPVVETNTEEAPAAETSDNE